MDHLENQPDENQTTVGDWVLTIFLSVIPLVGIVLLFIWGFGNNTPVNKANWAKATLIWHAIGIVFMFLFFAIFGAAILMAIGEGRGF